MTIKCHKIFLILLWNVRFYSFTGYYMADTDSTKYKHFMRNVFICHKNNVRWMHYLLSFDFGIKCDPGVLLMGFSFWRMTYLILTFSFMSEEDALFNDPREVNNMKRHSEGTFSNDYSKYLETRRAQDFVQWLMNSKRSGWVY